MCICTNMYGTTFVLFSTQFTIFYSIKIILEKHLLLSNIPFSTRSFLFATIDLVEGCNKLHMDHVIVKGMTFSMANTKLFYTTIVVDLLVLASSQPEVHASLLEVYASEHAISMKSIQAIITR